MRPGHVHSSLLAVNQSVSPTESKSTSPLSQHRSFLVRLMITAIDIESKTFLHRSTNLFLAHRAARTIFNSSFNIFFLLFFSTRENLARRAHVCIESDRNWSSASSSVREDENRSRPRPGRRSNQNRKNSGSVMRNVAISKRKINIHTHICIRV